MGEVDMKKLISNLAAEQERDTELNKITLALSQIPNVPHKWEKHFSLFNKHLFHRANEQGDDWKLCIPKVIIPEVVRDCHLRYGHIGPKKCSDILKESCKFNNMERTVRKILQTCEICQKAKVNNRKQEGLMQHVMPVSYTHLDVYKRQQ